MFLTKEIIMCKVLNCQCQQCKKSKGKAKLYQAQVRKARRAIRQYMWYNVQRKNYEIDPPVKYQGLYST